jgi:hypothetical protein
VNHGIAINEVSVREDWVLTTIGMATGSSVRAFLVVNIRLMAAPVGILFVIHGSDFADTVA